jgi:cellulose synthase/poly-beta-1,6-N-acetylglucosamine synthase-like glycosyltransferase
MSLEIVSDLSRLALLARTRIARRRMGFASSHAVNERRRQAFCAALPPFHLVPREARRYAIVVPCYNHAEFLPQAFRSIEAQTLPPSEVILTDDHSTDATWQVLSELAAATQLPRGTVKTHRNSRNLGQCATLNGAVGRAASDVIVVLNDDDYLMHDALEWIDFVFRTHPTVGLVGARGVHVASQVRLDNLKKSVTAALISSDLAVHISDPVAARSYSSARQLDMCHSGSAFLKQVWEAVGGYYPEKDRRVVFPSDRDFQLRVNCLCPVAVVMDGAFAFWRVGTSVDAGLFT